MTEKTDHPSTQPLVTIAEAAISRNGQPVLKDIDLVWRHGEHWAIAGGTGTGKTLLLQLISGRATPSKGHFYHEVADDYLAQHKDDGTYRSFRDLIVYVSPKHHFKNRNNTRDFYYQQRFNSTDAEEAITVGEYLTAIRPIWKNAGWTFEQVIGLMNLREQTEKSLIMLSNGETRKVMLAAALLKNPALLLLDNPLVGLDAYSRQQFSSVVDRITASGIHVMMATTPDEIPDAITHVALLEEGRPLQVFPKASFKPELSYQENTAFSSASGQSGLESLISRIKLPSFTYIVRMEQITVAYGTKQILDQVSWTVKQGEHWVLQGPNGAGKSTLLSLINGDNPQAYRNNITLFDRRRGTGESIWDIKKHIGFVSPELHQYFPVGQTCLQVVLSGYFDTIGLFRKPSQQQKDTAMSWLGVFGLSHLSGTRLSQLHLGEQRRCLLARALIKSPSLLILDEPCQNLNDEQREQFKSIISEIAARSNITIVYVSHYQADIPPIEYKTLALQNGKVTGNQKASHI